MKVDVICEICGCIFQREKGELTRNAKKGRKVYCSRICAGKSLIGNIPTEKRTWKHLRSDNRRDGYTMFRVFLARIKVRMRDHDRECNLTLEDLKNLWEKQRGICPYTGWQMITPRSTSAYCVLSPKTASLDRIDSDKGYIKGNVEFICLMAQYAKNHFKKDDVMDFCEAVAKHKEKAVAGKH